MRIAQKSRKTKKRQKEKVRKKKKKKKRGKRKTRRKAVVCAPYVKRFEITLLPRVDRLGVSANENKTPLNTGTAALHLLCLSHERVTTVPF